MPYVRRTYKKLARKPRTYRKRRTYAPRRRAFMSKLKPEMKKYDNNLNPSGIDIATPYIQNISNVAQGVADNERVGNQIVVKSLYGRYKINPVSQDNSFRMLVVVDNQQVADTVPALSDLLDDSFSTYMIAPLNNKTVGRFTVLLDRIIQTDRGAAGTGTYGVKYGSFYKKLNVPVRYNGITGSDIQKNGIYLFILTDDVATDPDPTVNIALRVSFRDV